MSIIPEMDLDLDKLFLPAWAQEAPPANRYADYRGEEAPPTRDREGRRGRPFPRRDDRGPRTGPPRRDDRRGGPRREGRGDRRGPRPEGRPEQREVLPPPPDLNVTLLPDAHGVESLARQIKTTGRAYPLFGIAQLILQKPERYSVRFSVKKKPDGQPVQALFVCALDDTLWLSEDEAVAHVLRHHFATFYQTERTATEPPKGTYTFVAQCGMSGIILGPPNHHDYQNQLRKLHTERFSRMPFETFKARVRIVRDEEVVKKWVDDQSWKTEYVCLNMPEPLKLPSMEEVERHFRSVHKENIIKTTETHTLSGVATRGVRCPGLSRLARQISLDQQRFPLQVATILSQQFAGHGLQFFKVNKTVTHVSVARPHYLDLETTPVSDGIKRIVEFINSHPKCNRRKLIDGLAPAPVPVAPAAPAAPAEGTTAPTEGAAPAAPAAPAEATPEQTAVISDLHWLVHQGHVIEFANGILETAKKPAPRPPKPEPKAPEPKAPEASAEAAPAESSIEVPATEPATAATAPSPEEPKVPPVEPTPGVPPEAPAPTPPDTTV